MFRLDGKVAIVTGGASGIGRSIASLMAAQGATVCILDIDEKGGADTVAEIREKNGKALFRICNVSLKNEVLQVIEDLVNAEKKIDILVNNAGIAHVGNVEQASESDVDRLISINIKGVYHLLHAVVPFMKANGGVILNMASIAASVGLADRFAYSMTKAAVVGMTLSVAKDYLKNNIRCNCMSPARVHTPFVDGFIAKNYPGHEKEMFEKLAGTQPIGRMAQPDEIAVLALYLCSEESGFITGSDYPIDGGFIKLNT